jgi:hypothetical protein
MPDSGRSAAMTMASSASGAKIGASAAAGEFSGEG